MTGNSEFDVVSGPWSAAEVARFLRLSAIPIRLATQGRKHPLVQSVWFHFDGEAIWCCTQADSVLARRLQRNSQCGFEVAADTPPYRGVRGHGVAEFHPELAEEKLNTLIDRYLDEANSELSEWLRSRVANEAAIAIRQLRVSSWDYRPRMS